MGPSKWQNLSDSPRRKYCTSRSCNMRPERSDASPFPTTADMLVFFEVFLQHLWRQLFGKGTGSQCLVWGHHFSRRPLRNHLQLGRESHCLSHLSAYRSHPTSRWNHVCWKWSTSDLVKGEGKAMHFSLHSWSLCPTYQFQWSNFSRHVSCLLLDLDHMDVPNVQIPKIRWFHWPHCLASTKLLLRSRGNDFHFSVAPRSVETSRPDPRCKHLAFRSPVSDANNNAIILHHNRGNQ